jgi:hypothetical protein
MPQADNIFLYAGFNDFGGLLGWNQSATELVSSHLVLELFVLAENTMVTPCCFSVMIS